MKKGNQAEKEMNQIIQMTEFNEQKEAYNKGLSGYVINHVNSNWCSLLILWSM